jgi:hypothetical protein
MPDSSLNTDAQFRPWQAWLITAEYLDPLSSLKERFVALLDYRVDSATILQITLNLFKSSLLAFDGQSSLRPDQSGEPYAGCIILNDGSEWEDHIVCGHNPGLRARHVCDITIDTDQDGLTHISWRKPHIIVQDDRREIEYWEEGTLPMIMHSSH